MPAADSQEFGQPLAAEPTTSDGGALGAVNVGAAGAPGLGAATAGEAPATELSWTAAERAKAAAKAAAAAERRALHDMKVFSSPQEYQDLTGGGDYGQPGVNNTRKALAQFAKKFVGTPYVWGGTNLESGVDCSGFVQSVYKHFGINIPRVSYQQANYGHRTSLDKLRAGDLVAWDNSSRNNGADHIAIYLGGGLIIEAPRPGVGVRIRKLGSGEGAWGVAMNL